jgi:aldehyde:ferredoxin oxidoreductase
MSAAYLRLDLSTGQQQSDPVVGFGGPLQALGNLRAALKSGQAELPVALVTTTVAGVDGVALARCAAVGVSPLSGTVAETRAEGPYAAGLRNAGVVGIELIGTAPRPSYVVVQDGRATIHPADDLWGLDTRQATGILLARHGPGTAVAAIGPAGEAGTAYAAIVTNAGFPLPRSGFGAILGARRIKAVVCVPGDSRPAAHDRAAVDALTTAYQEEMRDHPLAGWQHAVPGFGAWPGSDENPGHAAVRNFADTRTAPAAWRGLSPDRYAPSLSWSAGGCPGCPNDCIKGYADGGLHQEAVAMLGPNLGIGDLAVVLAANRRCQELGLDPVSLGGTLGCLFEANVQPDWLPFRVGFGAADRLLELVELAALPGHQLGRGAASVGRMLGAPECAMVSRDIELPPFDPRVQPGLGLMYAAAPTGPRYDAVEHDLDFDPEHGLPYCYPEARTLGLSVPSPASTLDVNRTLRLADLWSGLDALLICPYASTPTRPLTLDRVCALVHAVTGVPLPPAAVFAIGRARLAVQQEINDILSVGRGTLPARFFAEPVEAGVFAGAVLSRAEFAAGVATLQKAWRSVP